MNAVPRLLRLGLGMLALLGGSGRAADLQPAWQALSVGSFDDAVTLFKSSGDSREARLGLAIAQLNRPPVTPSSLKEAERQLAEMTAGSDEPARAARYFLGRLQQMHPVAPDPAAAAKEYERLVDSGADDTWCRLALIKLAILRLTLLGAANDPAANTAVVDALFERTQDAGTRRDLHLIISEVRLNHRVYDTETLRHLQAALAATSANDLMRADLLVQVGRLASKLGDLATARTCFEEFLRAFPKERRGFTVAQALAHLGRPFPP